MFLEVSSTLLPISLESKRFVIRDSPLGFVPKKLLCLFRQLLAEFSRGDDYLPLLEGETRGSQQDGFSDINWQGKGSSNW